MRFLKLCKRLFQTQRAKLVEKHDRSTSSSISATSQTHSDLQQEIRELQSEILEFKKTSQQVLHCQADAVLQHKSAVIQGPISLDAFHQLDFNAIITELQVQAPDL